MSKIKDYLRKSLLSFLVADKLDMEVENVDREREEITITFGYKDSKDEEAEAK